MASKEARARATKEYMKDKHVIRVVVTKEKADKYRNAAEASGKSLNRFIVECIEKVME